jgi:hypothetical protein
MSFQAHGIIAAVLTWAGVAISLGTVVIFFTGGFGIFPMGNGGAIHDSRYIILKFPIRLMLLLMPLVAGMLLAGTGVILTKQILATARNFPEIMGQF